MVSRTGIRRYSIALATVLVLAVSSGGGETLPSGIEVTLDTARALSLHVTITSNAKAPVSVATWRLPWGAINSAILVAVTPDKEYVVRNFPEEYPHYQHVIFDPNKSLSGDISLEQAFTGLDAALKKSDVHLFWAYQPPEDLRLAHWSGGWILIPQQK